jgi:PAS domain S-box-containing protein
MFQAKDGSVQGFYVDFLQEIAKKEGWDIEYVYGNWADGLAKIKSGEVDVLTNVAYTDERATFMDFGKVPLLTVWAELYVSKSSHIDNIRDVRNKKIAIMKGDFNAANFKHLVEKFEIPCRFVEYGNFEEVFKAISDNQVDGGIVNNTFGTAKRIEYDLKSTGVIFNPFDIYFTVAKGENKQLIATLDKYLTEWRKYEDSPYHMARENWSHKSAATIRVIPSWLQNVLIIFITISALFTIFIIMLRIQVNRKTKELKIQLDERTLLERTLFIVNESGAALRGDELLTSITSHLSNTLDVEYAFVSQLLPENDRVKTKGLIANGARVKDIEYYLQGTPCENVVGKTRCFYESNIIEQFPDDKLLVEMDANGYAATPLWDSKGLPIGLMGIISKRPLKNKQLIEAVLNIVATRAAQELEAMNRLFELEIKNYTIGNIKDAVYWVSSEGNLWDVNHVATSMLGYTHDEMLSMSVADIDFTYTADKWAKNWESVKSLGNRNYESCHRTKAGAVIPVDLTVTYCKFNEMEYLFVIARDISLRKSADDLNKKLIVMQRSILDNLPMMAWLKDKNGHYEMVNDMFINNVGISAVDIVGKTDFDVFTNDLATRYSIDDQEVMQTRMKKQLEEQGSDSTRSYLTFKSPLIDGNNEVIGTTGVALDITELKKSEEEMKMLHQQISHSQRIDALGRLAGGIAHDFNNKLTVILGYAELSKMIQCQKSKECGDNIEEIIRAAQYAQEITRRLLAFSREETINQRKLDLNTILSEIKKTLGRLIGEHITIHFDLQKDLWPVYMDPTQFDQVITNLVVNARDAMNDGGQLIIKTMNVTIENNNSQVPLGEFIIISCADTGEGMDESTMQHIFEPFFTTKSVGKGTGLGLSSVYGIVKQSNGYVTVTSKPGKGTTFTIYLPRMTDDSESMATINSDKPTMTGSGTILLVEDDEAVLKITKLMLESIGYKVIAATSPNAAINLCMGQHNNFDCVLSDVIMPSMNGIELKNHIKSLKPELPFVFMSGYTADIITGKIPDVGDVEVVKKPLNYFQLNSVLNRLINNGRTI